MLIHDMLVFVDYTAITSAGYPTLLRFTCAYFNSHHAVSRILSDTRDVNIHVMRFTILY